MSVDRFEAPIYIKGCLIVVILLLSRKDVLAVCGSMGSRVKKACLRQAPLDEFNMFIRYFSFKACAALLLCS